MLTAVATTQLIQQLQEENCQLKIQQALQDANQKFQQREAQLIHRIHTLEQEKQSRKRTRSMLDQLLDEDDQPVHIERYKVRKHQHGNGAGVWVRPTKFDEYGHKMYFINGTWKVPDDGEDESGYFLGVNDLDDDAVEREEELLMQAEEEFGAALDD